MKRLLLAAFAIRAFDVSPAERTCAPRLPISVDISSSWCR